MLGNKFTRAKDRHIAEHFTARWVRQSRLTYQVVGVEVRRRM